MKKTILIFIFSLLIIPNISNAHPGRTDSSGCHTCRTNCINWGLSYDEYHCHNNKGTVQPEEPIKSIYGVEGGYTIPAPDYEYKEIEDKKPSEIQYKNEGLNEITAREQEASSNTSESGENYLFLKGLGSVAVLYLIKKKFF